MQPIVGVISDRSSHKWGRRRPFIFFGSLCIGMSLMVKFHLHRIAVVGMLLISNASYLGSLFSTMETGNPIAITIAVSLLVLVPLNP